MHRLCCVITSFSVCFLRNRWDNSCVVMTSLLWLTAEEAAKNRGKVLSLYRQLLRSVSSPKLQLSYASRLAKKAEIKTIFLFGSEEVSKHNVADLIRTGEYALSQLKQGKIPNNTTQY
uniref:LYR motif containing domain-containing protein n=1 Tax=Brassica campestris TaxID=3711 RepID=A0A3P6B5C3_BRACM|nr:unnamed protein product [Brassica rapa]